MRQLRTQRTKIPERERLSEMSYLSPAAAFALIHLLILGVGRRLRF